MVLTKVAPVLAMHLSTSIQPLSEHICDADSGKLINTSNASLSMARYRFRVSKVMTMGLLALFSAFLLLSGHALFSGVSDSPRLAAPHPFDLQESWAQYSPFFPVKQYEGPPRRCSVLQV
jgi:hypothetical protein